jgi:enoyl-CoA hydratase/carnithine racemase
MDDLTAIRLDVTGAVGVVTLARPDKLNALNRAMVEELTTVVERLVESDDVRALVLVGEGRMFSAGADIEEFRESFGAGDVDPATVEAESRLGSRLTDALQAPGLITIAAIHGAAIGGAAALVAACDLRVMAAGSRIVVPELIMGFPLAWGGMERLVRDLGPSVVRDLVLTCRPLEAGEALARGFACRVVPAAETLDGARELAELVATRPAHGTTVALRRITALSDRAGAPGVDDDAVSLAAASTDPDVMAATRAYLDSLTSEAPSR